MPDYAEIMIDLVSDAVDRPFHYRIPPELREKVEPGSAVTVPFGNRRCRGYVLRLLEKAAVGAVRDIIATEGSEPLLQKEQLALIPWMAHRYYCRRIEALHALVPAAFRTGREITSWAITLTGAAGEADLSRAPLQRQAVSLLRRKGPLPRAALTRAGVRGDTLRALLRKGLIAEIPITQAGAPPLPPVKNASFPPLNDEQQRAFDELAAALDSPRAAKILLHGITASGKTEIYLRGITRCISSGRGALVLVPEISLTPQMIDLFQGRFPGRIAVLHSRLTPAEKARHWQRIRTGSATVVLGARSAVFAPLERPGLIVIDEEHENSYKQEDSPRYHAREVAWWRARYHRAVLMLGSATPSLESYHEGLAGGSKLLVMVSRATPSQLPPVSVVDMRDELSRGNRHIFSRLLQGELRAVLERRQQAILFLNRRGFASFVLCRECGLVVRCPSCDVSMTLHRDSDSMVCHYCSHETPVPRTCSSCSGIQIRHFGTGTQRVEDEVKQLFPGVSLVRMDSDTTSGRGSHQELYRRFREGKASILIGTQMIAKGFDFPGVTLVGVVTADTALNLPDFRAAERTFQLLTQVSGRAGRGEGGGRVIVQTYHPGHYAIKAAARHDYAAFFEEELEHRRALAYPPFSDLVRFLFSGEDEASVFDAAAKVTARLEGCRLRGELLGPAPAPLFRLKSVYRVHAILKGERLAAQAPWIRAILREFRSSDLSRQVRLAVDFNPQVVL